MAPGREQSYERPGVEETNDAALDDEAERLGAGSTLAGDVAFKLYDTYGFPVDLTADALKAKNIAVDMDGFNTAMEKQKAEAL